MRATWQSAVEIASQYGFSHAVMLPARQLASLIPNPESLRQRIITNPQELLEGAQSILVAAMPFSWHSAWPMDCAEVSAFYFASQQAHSGILAIAERLREAGARVSDDQRLANKLLARDAGMGVIGRNSLVHNDLWGSCFTLRILVTDIAPQPGFSAMPATACGECMRCVQACPTGALDGTGAVNTERCLRTHMLRGTLVPQELRAPMGLRLLGCEICQRACPHNAQVPCQPPDVKSFSIEALLRSSREDLSRIAHHIGWNEARLQRVQSQAALVAGNSENPDYLPVLRTLARHKRPSLSAHAQWAIEKIQRSDVGC